MNDFIGALVLIPIIALIWAFSWLALSYVFGVC